MRIDNAAHRRSGRRAGLLVLATCAAAAVLAACAPSEAPTAQADSGSGAGAGQSDYMPRATLAELMESIVMPAADVLWNAVAVNVTANGIEETKPETDEDWARLRWAAVELEEAANLIVIPGRAVDAPGAESEAPDVELAPAEIQALIESNRAAFVSHAHALQATAIQALKAVDARDIDGISEVGGAIDEACESCHTQFWYPEQEQ